MMQLEPWLLSVPRCAMRWI